MTIDSLTQDQAKASASGAKNLLIGQSGGPTAVINASLYGVIEEVLSQKQAHPDRIDRVLGMCNGIAGYLQNATPEAPGLVDLTKLTLYERELLKTTPAAYLGSCRFQLPRNMNDVIYEQLFDQFEKDNIGYVLYIGGNDSMDTVDKLSQAAIRRGSDIKIMGICKTIDNDLCETDHTPGYGSAAKYVASAVRQMVMDAEVYTVDSVLIVEIMGRDAGWITAASSLARKFKDDNPVLIYLPEVDFDLDDMIEKTKELLKHRHTVCVCVSEGIHDSTGRLVCEMSRDMHVDAFGHKQLAGCGKVLETEVRNRLGVKVRSVELNLPQRCSAVEASLIDVTEAAECGRESVRSVLNGANGKMIAMKRISDDPYQIRYQEVDVKQVCNLSKNFPLDWIKDDSDITDEFVRYVSPLVQGESRPPMKNGLPEFLYRRPIRY